MQPIMIVIFCRDPQVEASPDPAYIDEVAAATHHGLQIQLIDYAALTEQDNPARAILSVPVQDTLAMGVYRGWPLTARQYEGLYNALLSRGVRLITSPDAYRLTHHLPASL